MASFLKKFYTEIEWPTFCSNMCRAVYWMTPHLKTYQVTIFTWKAPIQYYMASSRNQYPSSWLFHRPLKWRGCSNSNSKLARGLQCDIFHPKREVIQWEWKKEKKKRKEKKKKKGGSMSNMRIKHIFIKVPVNSIHIWTHFGLKVKNMTKCRL